MNTTLLQKGRRAALCGLAALVLLVPSARGQDELGQPAADEPPKTAAAETTLLPADALAAFRLNPSAVRKNTGKLEIVDVTGQTFKQALRVQSLTAKGGAQVYAQSKARVAKGDRVVVTFWARAAAPTTDGEALIVVEGAKAPNKRSVEWNTRFGTDWKKFEKRFPAADDYTPGGLNIAFKVGETIQTIELGDVRVVNRGKGGASGEPKADLLRDGTPLLAADALDVSTLEGDAKATAQREKIVVEKQAFTHAIRVRVPTLPLRAADVQLVLPLAQPVQAGDVLLARVWMRGKTLKNPVTGRAHLTIVLEGDRTVANKTNTIMSGPDWRQFDVPIEAKAKIEAGAGRLALQLGLQPQEVEVGSVVLVNLGKSVGFTSLAYLRNRNRGDNDKPQEITPAEQAPDAPWRLAARERIDKHRKGDLLVVVQNAQGKPLAGAQVRVAMKRHAFAWGTAVDARTLVGQGPDNDKYREIVTTLFNQATLENDLKWPYWSRERAHKAITWLRAHDLPVRGHTLMWANWSFVKDGEAHKTDAARLQKHITDHIKDEATELRDQVREWDVLNEPYTNNLVMGVLGDAAMVEWFKTARAAAPKAALFLNEFNNLEDQNGPQMDAFEKAIRFLLDNNAPLDGIGMQGHLHRPTSPVRLLEILDRFARFNKKIAVTEWDYRSRDEEKQAAYTRDFLTAVFSHPAVDSITAWGFWESKHWIPEAAMFRKNWTIKPNGQVWKDLVLGAWWTKAEGTTDPRGVYATRGFLGDYELTVTAGGKTRTVPTTLSKGGQRIKIVLP